MAVTFNNTNTASFTTSANSLSAARSVTSGGTNTTAFAVIGWNGAGATISTVTYNGVSMTSCGAIASGAGGVSNVQIFFLSAPATGSNTLAVTGSGTMAVLEMNLVSFNGVNQTTPVRPSTYTSVAGATSPLSLVITSNTSDLTISVAQTGFFNISATNQTSDGFANSGSAGWGSDHATTAASSVTHSWTSGAAALVIAGFSIQAASAASTTLRLLPLTGVGT